MSKYKVLLSDDMDIFDKVELLLEKGLCDHCLGRMFAQLGHGLTNDMRGRSLRVVYAMVGSEEERKELPEEPDECSLCGNIFDEIDGFVSIIKDEMADYEFDTFLVGTRIDPEIQEKEEAIWAEVDIEHSEPIKTELNREIGKRVFDEVDAEVDLERPDLKAIIDTRFDSLEIELAPLFIYGRYRKLSTEIPQTSWPCKRCRGTGCEKCDGTGKMYETSVEEIAGEPLLEKTEGDEFILHGMGREDIDVKMLGEGRPFVMEIKNPIKRDIDLDRWASEVNEDGRVEIDSIEKTDKDKVVEIKEERADKTYRVYVSFDEKVERGKFKKVLKCLRGAKLSQRTPNRVKHRRADKVREREIKEIHLEEFQEKKAVITLRCEAGTYVKEFIHGDEGRTQPNLSEELGIGCVTETLEVIDVHYEA